MIEQPRSIQLMNAVAEIEQLRIQLAAAETERDALRALLGEVRKMAENGVLYNEPLNARIDAALNKGGGDE